MALSLRSRPLYLNWAELRDKRIPLKGTVQVKTTATPLQAKGSVDVPMTIATPKVEWNRTEMLGDGTSSDYSVSAVLAPGDWTGTVTFECLVQ